MNTMRGDAGPAQERTDEEKIRAMVREMWAMPEGREALEWFFNLPPIPFEHVIRRLNRDVKRPDRQMSDEDIAAIVEDHIRRQFPNAPADAATWDRWPA